jgi:pimeloyl-ACP methyl ester carboxylesterase
MTTWSEDELRKIVAADDLHISPFREDGVTHGTPTWIWSVVVDEATRYRTIDVGGLEIFYRDGGPAAAPVVLMLHGFRTSSRMFRKLIPILADKYPGDRSRLSGIRTQRRPISADFSYTHAHLSEVVEALIEKLGVKRFAMYVMDFGGPIGYRLMLKYPDRVTGVVVQNTPAFGEPIEGPLWTAELAYLEGWLAGASGRGPVQADAGRRSQSVPRRDA